MMQRPTHAALAAMLLLAAAWLVPAARADVPACPTWLGRDCPAPGALADGAPEALPLAAPVMPGARMAAGGCGPAAAAAAASVGGQVIGAPRQVQQGGRTMCVVTVLVRDPTGRQPPTRRQITVPAN